MSRITLTKRSGDWHACKEGNKCQWEAGRTPEEAIKKLRISHPECDGEVIYAGEDRTAGAYALVMGARLIR